LNRVKATPELIEHNSWHFSLEVLASDVLNQADLPPLDTFFSDLWSEHAIFCKYFIFFMN
jgi:hypothetical protein